MQERNGGLPADPPVSELAEFKITYHFHVSLLLQFCLPAATKSSPGSLFSGAPHCRFFFLLFCPGTLNAEHCIVKLSMIFPRLTGVLVSFLFF